MLRFKKSYDSIENPCYEVFNEKDRPIGDFYPEYLPKEYKYEWVFYPYNLNDIGCTVNCLKELIKFIETKDILE